MDFWKPIFKKYRIVFDKDKKKYGIYKYYQKENKNENKIINNPNDNDSNNNRFIIFYVIIFILSLFVIIESIFIIRKYLGNKRPNELKDENDYDNLLFE